MKIKKPVLFASLAIVLSLLLTWGYLRVKIAGIESVDEPIIVVSAKKNISEGSLIDESYLKRVKIPRRFVQPGAVSSLDVVAGKVSRAPILKGEQILQTKLIPLSAKSGLSVRMPDGLRALSIAVDDVSGVAGLLRPNNFVDLMATFEMEDSTESLRVATYTIAQHILVLAVGDDLGIGPPIKLPSKRKKKTLFPGNQFTGALSRPRKKTITLALTPNQAQAIEFAKQQGKISVALRGQWDEEILELNPTTALDVVGFKGRTRKNRFREYRGR